MIITREDSTITDVKSLSGKKVAYPQGFFYDELLKSKFPDILRVPMENTLATLIALQVNQVEAALGEVAVVRYLIRENWLTGLTVKAPFDSGEPEIEKLNIAVRNDWPALQSILKKAIDSVTPAERAQMQRKWLDDQGKNIALSQQELAWLETNPMIRLAVDPGWMPLERINVQSGRHEGIIAEYLQLFSERSGL